MPKIQNEANHNKNSESHQKQQLVPEWEEDNKNISTLNRFPAPQGRIEFKGRPSILDDLNNKSSIRTSFIFGFFTLAQMFVAYFYFCYMILRYSSKGQLFETQIYDYVKRDFFMALMYWPLFILWSHSALILQKLIILGIPRKVQLIYQHLTQFLCLVSAIYVAIVRKDWFPSNRAFVAVMAVSFFMKMHSYTIENRRLREQWLKQQNGEKQSDDQSTKALNKQKQNQNKNNSNSPVEKVETQQNQQNNSNQELLDEEKQKYNEFYYDEEPQEYPKNINWRNFIYFVWVPTMIYRTSYPRNRQIRPLYLILKISYFIASMFGVYILLSDFFFPILHSIHEKSFIEVFLSSIQIIFYVQMTIYYMVWQILLNVLAQILRFGDRQFYSDWWNSTGYDQFNQKWNRPIFDFFHEYIQLPLIEQFSISQERAYDCVIIGNALAHEFILSTMTSTFKPLIFILMIIQMPIYRLFNRFQNTQLGNAIFWLAFLTMLPLITTIINKY